MFIKTIHYIHLFSCCIYISLIRPEAIQEIFLVLNKIAIKEEIED